MTTRNVARRYSDCCVAANEIWVAAVSLKDAPRRRTCESTSGVCTENSNPDVVMVKPAEDRM
jgi:hypothetical protein